ncbi:hypothetical protein [Nonomuraea sp. NPDC050310]|uniref:hypothetical protein n=1 Tax=Nonomuraea sp. NPDC050310 TaxID=3154935 RepID=UPI0033C16E21
MTRTPPIGLFRAVVSVHTVAAFAQPALAGVYLSGNIDGLTWHARIADVVSYAGLAQVVLAVVVSARTRRRWPVAASALIVVAEFGQYVVGMNGLLWAHLPLGVTVVAALAVLFTVVWVRPPARALVGVDG